MSTPKRELRLPREMRRFFALRRRLTGRVGQHTGVAVEVREDVTVEEGKELFRELDHRAL